MNLYTKDDWDSQSPAPGLYTGIPDEWYHGLSSNYVSNSLLKRVRRSALHARAMRQDNGVKDALKFGRAFHTRMESADLFRDTYARFEGDRRRKADRERYNGLVDVFGEWCILSEPDFKHIEAMCEAIERHPVAAQYVESEGHAEVTSIWELAGMTCKSRFDKLLPDGTIVDWKTTQNADPAKWPYDALRRYRYDQQAAFYLASLAYHGIEPKGFVFVAVEKTPPYGVSVWETPRSILEPAWEDIIRLMDRWGGAVESGDFVGYEPVLHELTLEWQ